eukprot:748782-Hanusia_phi.AAC.2
MEAAYRRMKSQLRTCSVSRSRVRQRRGDSAAGNDDEEESSFEGFSEVAGERGGAFRLRSQPLQFFSTTLSRPSLFLHSCLVQPNSAKQGGGLSSEIYSSVSIKDSRLQDNRASKDGGAVYLEKTSSRLDGNTFLRNSAGGGEEQFSGMRFNQLWCPTWRETTRLWSVRRHLRE